MPTDENVNASVATASNAEGSTPAITDEVITSHPKFKELEQKYSAARTGMDTSNLSKKQLAAEVARLKVLAGEEETAPPEEKPAFVTRAELEAKAWELSNKKDLDLYADETYKEELSQGIPPAKALEYAKLRYQSNPQNAKVQRQQAMSSQGSTSVRDLSDVEITDEDRADMKMWGYSEETLLKQKRMKKERA